MKLILPLFSTAPAWKREVAIHSGLNQWNAAPRKDKHGIAKPRDPGEVYIPIPSAIQKRYPDFFPDKHTHFCLRLPSGQILSAKICQQGSKALMTTPNNAIAGWLLRELLQLKEKELLTRARLEEKGFDSVVVTDEGILPNGKHLYSIDKAGLGTYEAFLRGEYRP